MITSIETNSTYLVSSRNLPIFKNTIDLLVAHFDRNVDKTCKKHIALILKDLFIDYSGLYQTTDSVNAFGKKIVVDPSINKTLVGTYNE